MFIPACDVHRVLKRALGPQLRAAGYRAVRGSSAGWERVMGEPPAAVLSVWFQCSGGSNRETGGRLCGSIQLSAAHKPGAVHLVAGVAAADFRRTGALLTAGELAEVRARHDAVRRKLPRPGPDHWVHGRREADPGLYAYYFEQLAPVPAPYAVGDDLWFEYLDAADVEFWAAFVGARLPRWVSGYCAELGVAAPAA